MHSTVSRLHDDPRALWGAGLALAAAMGVGRFAFTPVLPLMESQAGLTPAEGAHLATANYVGYLVGAVVLSVAPGLAGSRTLARTSVLALVASLALMPLTESTVLWALLRVVAGVTSAVLFITATRVAVRATRRTPHRAGYAYAGVGSGIALSGGLVLLLDTRPWPLSWYASAGCALALSVPLWMVLRRETEDTPTTSPEPRSGRRNIFALLLGVYFLEGVGYIIAATFLVAALSGTGLPWLGGTAWILVGIAAAPSCAVWAIWSRQVSRPALLVAALLVQAVSVAVPGLTSHPVAVILCALVFGGTFMGITTLALGLGAELGIARSAATLTAGYGLGQVVGPVLVQSTLGDGYELALLVGGVVLLVGTALAGVLFARTRKPVAPLAHA